MYEAEIQAAIDRQWVIEQKAAAWDHLVTLMDPVKDRAMLALLTELVHPARTLSTSEGSVTQDAERK